METLTKLKGTVNVNSMHRGQWPIKNGITSSKVFNINDTPYSIPDLSKE